MAGYQNCQIIGNVGADPELRHTQASDAVATFRVAVNETWKDKDGAKQERAEWFRVVAWGKLAEVCEQYLKKGRQVHVVGKLRTREWDDKEGNKRYTTELNADAVTFLGAADGERGGSDRERPAERSGARGNGNGNGGSKPKPAASERYSGPANQREVQDTEMDDSDIPF